MEEGRGVYMILVRKPEGRKTLGRPKRRWEVILKLIFKKSAGKTLIGYIWLRIGTDGGLL
jgi:hypothetical protein